LCIGRFRVQPLRASKVVFAKMAHILRLSPINCPRTRQKESRRTPRLCEFYKSLGAVNDRTQQFARLARRFRRGWRSCVNYKIDLLRRELESLKIALQKVDRRLRSNVRKSTQKI